MKLRSWSFSPKWLAAPTVTALTAMAARSAWACASCGLDPSDPRNDGYRTSVIFMMAAPYMLFLIGGVVAFFAYRNAARRQASAQSGGPESENTPSH